MSTEPFTSVVLPGSTDQGKLFITIEWDGKRLSITGVEGPKRNGDARGGWGQCRSTLGELLSYVNPWTADMAAELSNIWQRWHLNDMRAGCEHQRAAGWDKRPIDRSKPLDAYGEHVAGHTTWNMLTWVKPSDHPAGLLTKPCQTCGYRYGSAWLTEEVPEEVLKWLHDLPQSTQVHPWGDKS